MHLIEAVTRSLFNPLLWLVSKVYSDRTSLCVQKLRNILYTLWIKNFIGQIGNFSSINYPCSLQGGGSKHIRIGAHTCIHCHSILGCWKKYNAHDGQQLFTPEIIIGNNCDIGEYAHITACNKIKIGDGLLTGRYVYIGDNSHGGLSWEEASILPAQRSLKTKGEIVIGNNVWIGDKVSILSGVIIGNNVIIGANAVVIHNIPDNCMVAGCPARIIKQLD